MLNARPDCVFQVFFFNAASIVCGMDNKPVITEALRLIEDAHEMLDSSEHLRALSTSMLVRAEH